MLSITRSGDIFSSPLPLPVTSVMPKHTGQTMRHDHVRQPPVSTVSTVAPVAPVAPVASHNTEHHSVSPQLPKSSNPSISQDQRYRNIDNHDTTDIDTMPTADNLGGMGSLALGWGQEIGKDVLSVLGWNGSSLTPRRFGEAGEIGGKGGGWGDGGMAPSSSSIAQMKANITPGAGEGPRGLVREGVRDGKRGGARWVGESEGGSVFGYPDQAQDDGPKVTWVKGEDTGAVSQRATRAQRVVAWPRTREACLVLQREVRSSAFSRDPDTIHRMARAVCPRAGEGGGGMLPGGVQQRCAGQKQKPEEAEARGSRGGYAVAGLGPSEAGVPLEDARRAVKGLLQAFCAQAMMEEFTASPMFWDEAMGLIDDAACDEEALAAVMYVRSFIKSDFFRGNSHPHAEQGGSIQDSDGKYAGPRRNQNADKDMPPVTHSITVFKIAQAQGSSSASQARSPIRPPIDLVEPESAPLSESGLSQLEYSGQVEDHKGDMSRGSGDHATWVESGDEGGQGDSGLDYEGSFSGYGSSVGGVDL
jgi:hypothetical protein